ncbi:9843_t:CDS:1, partial [Funneliformis geosporum]
MHGSLVSSKKRILNSRNNSSNPDTQPMNLSAILDQRSTSNNRDLRSYWNEQVAEWSQELWLPIMTDSAALPSISS